jgi:O-methyltransferase
LQYREAKWNNMARERDREAIRAAKAKLSPDALAVRDARLTYLNAHKLYSLETISKEIDDNHIVGDVVEFGIALGGSSILLAKKMSPERSFTGYDVFGMIPPPSERDTPKEHDRYSIIASGQSTGIKGDTYYGYQENLEQKVRDSFAAFGMPVDGRRISLVSGLFEDTVIFAPDRRIAFAHIDCDWYDPVMLCLTRTYAVLSPGGFIVLDDYNDWDGCRRATDEFLAAHPDLHLRTEVPHAVIVRAA